MLPGRKADRSDVFALPAAPPGWQDPPGLPVLPGGRWLHQDGAGTPNTGFAK